MRAIAYYRSRQIDPFASERSILEQRNSVAAWAADKQDREIITTYIEDESEGGPRYILKTAIEACKEHNACLLIASTETIGHGQPFYPRIRSVPIVKLPTPYRPLGYIKALPTGAPEGLSLYLDNHAEKHLCDIYLCNASGKTLRKLMVTIATINAYHNYITFQPQEGTGKSSSSRTTAPPIEQLALDHMILVTDYDVMMDRDSILFCDVTIEGETGIETSSRAIIDKGYSLGDFIRLRTIRGPSM